jgi:hypothetical protein
MEQGENRFLPSVLTYFINFLILNFYERIKNEIG